MKLVVLFSISVNLILGIIVVLSVWVGAVAPAGAACPGPRGIPCANGDVNADGAIDIGDPVYLLTHLFARGPLPKKIDCAPCDSCCPAPRVPATGQDRCSDRDGNVIPCSSGSFPGQDAKYAAGCPKNGRFVDHGDGTVTDTCTGLMWTKNTVGNQGYPWWTALITAEAWFVSGHDDWRLPNVRELLSLVDYGRFTSAIDPVFECYPAAYMTSTSRSGDLDDVWYVDFNEGVATCHSKSTALGFIRLVRG